MCLQECVCAFARFGLSVWFLCLLFLCFVSLFSLTHTPFGPTCHRPPLFPCITGCLFSGWLETLDDPSMGAFGRNRPGMRITAWNSGLWYARATHASLRLMTILAHRMESEPNTWDQASSHSRPPCIRMSARAICIRMCATAHTFFRTHTRGKPCSSGGVW